MKGFYPGYMMTDTSDSGASDQKADIFQLSQEVCHRNMEMEPESTVMTDRNKEMKPESTATTPPPPPPCAPYTVEEEVTTVRIPMFRPKLPFLEILHESGARGEVFTVKEIVNHVKNYIIRHQLFDPQNPVVVHCKNNKLGTVFQVDKFTVNEAVPLFLKNSNAVPDTCIRIRRQLVKRAVPGPHPCPSSGDMRAKATYKANQGTSSTCTAGPEPTPVVTSTTVADSVPRAFSEVDGAASSTSGSAGPGVSWSQRQQRKRTGDSDGPSRKRRTSVNFQYSDGGDEVDGATPFCVQVNMETEDRTGGHGPQENQQPVEEDSISVQYDSDHFALEYEIESSDHRSESEISSHDSTKDIVVVCRESDIEFWADYSDTEATSDVELSDADHWPCDSCGNKNIPFFRHCSKCWSLRPGWLPDSNLSPSTSGLPSSSTFVKSKQKGMVSSESSDEQLLSQSQPHAYHYRQPSDRGRRKIRVVSASSSGHNSESLASEDDAPGASQETCKEDSGISSVTLPSSHEAGESRNSDVYAAGSGRGGTWRGRAGRESDHVAPASEVCVVCASRPKTASIIHGNSGHQVCCYRCAKRLKRKSLPCPVCRQPIKQVIRNFIL